MPNLEDVFQTWRLGALVYLARPAGSGIIIRPAAFVFVIPGGFAWVEPSYADPYGASSPAYHERTGNVRENGDGFILRNEAGGPEADAAVYPFDPADPGMKDDAGPLTWFANHLKENGLQWQSERTRVHALVAVQD